MRVLIDHGMDVNAFVERHGSPLHYAVYIAGIEQTRLLLERGADRSFQYFNQTPVEMAKGRRDKSKDSMAVYELLSKEN